MSDGKVSQNLQQLLQLIAKTGFKNISYESKDNLRTFQAENRVSQLQTNFTRSYQKRV